MTILVADNDPGVSLVLEQMLLRAGYRSVEIVPDGDQALVRLERGGVELLICDLDMPGLSGEELVARLGTWDAPPPVIVVSAYLDAAIKRDLARSPALRSTFSKPFDLVDFTTAVRAVLGGEGKSETAAGEISQQGGLF